MTGQIIEIPADDVVDMDIRFDNLIPGTGSHTAKHCVQTDGGNDWTVNGVSLDESVCNHGRPLEGLFAKTRKYKEN